MNKEEIEKYHKLQEQNNKMYWALEDYVTFCKNINLSVPERFVELLKEIDDEKS